MKRLFNVLKEIYVWYFPKKEAKVFCIGMHKTGTTSLAKAMSILGYRVVDYPSVRLIGSRFMWFRGTQLDDYNCFTDATVIPLYKRLDKKFPKAKFILTTRDLDSWLESCSKWPNFNRDNVVGKRKIYRERVLGAKTYQREIFQKTYEAHHKDVYEYFKNRPDDLLVLDISSENKWQHICDFLKVSQPNMSYPHSNDGAAKIKIKTIIHELNLPSEKVSEVHQHFIDKTEVTKDDVINYLKVSEE
ncbi:sulfotransferase family protein [Psychroserpens sp. BH13MA-6]